MHLYSISLKLKRSERNNVIILDINEPYIIKKLFCFWLLFRNKLYCLLFTLQFHSNAKASNCFYNYTRSWEYYAEFLSTVVYIQIYVYASRAHFISIMTRNFSRDFMKREKNVKALCEVTRLMTIVIFEVKDMTAVCFFFFSFRFNWSAKCHWAEQI